MTRSQDTADAPAGASASYSAAVATAVVAGAFILVVSTLLTINAVRSGTDDPLGSPELSALKEQLFRHTGDEALTRKARDLDYRLRVEYFRRQRFTQRGGYLLAGGMVVFLVALKYAAYRRKKLPHPTAQPHGDTERLASAARWSVASVGVVLGATALVWAIAATDTLPGADGPGRRSTRARSRIVTYPGAAEIRKNFPRFRGPGGSGISAYDNVPDTWDARSGRNVLWSAPVPLPGHASPIIWSDRVFLTGADRDTREIYCFDADSGKLLWRRKVETPGGAKYPKDVKSMGTGYAASTPVADGQMVYVLFANGDLACFDFQGREIWAHNLGVPDNSYGHASSLAMWRNLLIVQYDQGDGQDGRSRLLALDGATGRVAWQARRSVPASWATPIVIETESGPQIITAANPWVIAYKPSDGREIWRADCLFGDVAPSPVFAGGLVLAVQENANLAAIRPDGQGNVTETHLAWTAQDGLPDICSPLSDGRRVWLLGTYGMLTCFDAKDGKLLWEHDLDNTFKSSPSLVGDRIFLIAESGETFVIGAGGEYKLLGKAHLGEPCTASPAFADGRIYLRGRKNLHCIARASE